MAAGKAKFRQRAFSILEKTKTILSFSQGSDEMNERTEVKGDTEVKKGWVEHTWSTFIERAEDDLEEDLQGSMLLSDFQKKKFRHFFYHVLDLNNDHVISEEDFTGLNSRVRHYMQWGVNTPQYLTLTEVHDHFMTYFLVISTKFSKKEDEAFDFGDRKTSTLSELSKPVKESVSIEEWVDVWGETVGKARKLDDLPMWLQYYPKTLFDTINRSGTGIITKNELKLFYTAFIDTGKLSDEALTTLTEKSYNAMTANGDVNLSYHIYKLSFLNFLLGKQPNGPGQFMFGTVAWDQETIWVSEVIGQTSDQETNHQSQEAKENNIKVTRESQQQTKSILTDNGLDKAVSNGNAKQTNNKKSEKKPKQNESVSIVDVIDKNGTRRKSIIV